MSRIFPFLLWSLAILTGLAAAQDDPPPKARVVQPLEEELEETLPGVEVEESEPVLPARVIPEEDEEVPVELEPEAEVRPARPVEDEPPAALPAPAPPVEEPVVKPRAVSRDELPPPAPSTEPEKPKIAVTLRTDPNARPITQRIPAPRGQIVDRNGLALVQNRVAWYPGIQLPLQEGLSDRQVLDAARAPLAWVKRTLPGGWNLTDEKILDHYRHRRWLALLSDALVPDAIAEEYGGKNGKFPPQGVVLRPFYLRTYPHKALASHILGYMGKSGGMPTGDIQAGELLWPPTIGKSGLEQKFDTELTGTPGQYGILYDAKGEKISEEWLERPTAGNTLVTSLDLRFQKIVEEQMKKKGMRGAFVIMDVKTGDVIAIASNPGFDPNAWVYGVADSEYKRLMQDKNIPLIARAVQGLYPPASTFKAVTALAFLESGKGDGNTSFSCPPGMYIGNLWKKNHTKRNEGYMNVVTAIKRSCNTWFYQAAPLAGGAGLASMGMALGFGEKTGIALPDGMEVSGRMPTPEYYQKNKRAMTGGTLANIAIGQGEVSATPLQVAVMMAAVANGEVVPRPRLVRHIQDVNGGIVQSFPPSVRGTLTIKKESLRLVRAGMKAVVHDGGGTGREASNRYVTMAGKTGTGEWTENPKRYVAWFGGFIPANNPEYAFAAIFEGDPGDYISGGKTVAPVVGDVFNEIYRLKRSAGEEVDDTPEKSEKALASSSSRSRSSKPGPGASASQASAAAPAAQPVVTPQPAKPAGGGLRGFLRRVTGRQ